MPLPPHSSLGWRLARRRQTHALHRARCDTMPLRGQSSRGRRHPERRTGTRSSTTSFEGPHRTMRPLRTDLGSVSRPSGRSPGTRRRQPGFPRRHPGRKWPVSALGNPGPHRRDAGACRWQRHPGARGAAARSAGGSDRGGTARYRGGVAPARGCAGCPAAAGHRRGAGGGRPPSGARHRRKAPVAATRSPRDDTARPVVASGRRAAGAADPSPTSWRTGGTGARQCRPVPELQPCVCGAGSACLRRGDDRRLDRRVACCRRAARCPGALGGALHHACGKGAGMADRGASQHHEPAKGAGEDGHRP